MVTWRRNVSLVLVLLLVGTLYAIAELWHREAGTRGAAIASHPPVCGLLTPAEIEAVLGRPVGAGKRIDTTPDVVSGPAPRERYDSCFWPVGGAGAGPDESRFVGVELGFTDLASYDAYGASVGQPSGDETVRAIRVGSAEGCCGPSTSSGSCWLSRNGTCCRCRRRPARPGRGGSGPRSS